MVDPSFVHLFLDSPLYMVREKAPALAEEAPQAKTVLKPLPELPQGALFLIDRPGEDATVEHAALEMIHKIGAAMKFSPEKIWIEAADLSEYYLSEKAIASTGARVVMVMGLPLPIKEGLAVPKDFTVRRMGKMALVATPKPELLVPDRIGRNALWQALKAELGL